jgi:hypothetical protein
MEKHKEMYMERVRINNNYKPAQQTIIDSWIRNRILKPEQEVNCFVCVDKKQELSITSDTHIFHNLTITGWENKKDAAVAL